MTSPRRHLNSQPPAMHTFAFFYCTMNSPSKDTLPTSEESLNAMINDSALDCEEHSGTEQPTTPVPADAIDDTKELDPIEATEGKEEAEVEGAAQEDLDEQTEVPAEKEDNAPPAQEVQEVKEEILTKRSKRKHSKMNGKEAKKAKPSIEITEAEVEEEVAEE